LGISFYQRVSIASYASDGIARGGMSVCLSVTLRYCIKTKKASVMISSPSDSLNILVSRNIWFITKFDRGHPERGRFLRLGWVRTGDFGEFSTNKPPYLRNGARYGPKLPLITNRKSYTRFRLVPKSTTLDDPELTLNGYYALCCITHMSFGAHHKNLNEDRPILSATEM